MYLFLIHLYLIIIFLDYNPNPTGPHAAFQSKATPYKPDPDANMGDKMPVLKKGGH